MKLDDYMKGMKVDVANCKVRGVCPLGKFCGSKVGEKGAALIPSVLQIKKGDILWTDLHFDPRVLIIRKGIFACMVHADREKEEVPPLAVWGGYCCGGWRALRTCHSAIARFGWTRVRAHEQYVLPTCAL